MTDKIGEVKKAEPRTCFMFQPIAMPVRAPLSGVETQTIQLQFIMCVEEKCMGWDAVGKKCGLVKGGI